MSIIASIILKDRIIQVSDSRVVAGMKNNIIVQKLWGNSVLIKRLTY